MEMLKKFFVAVILLLVVVVAWVGITIYFKQSSVDVDPNAITYTKQMKNSFDAEELDLVTDKTEKSFSVSPSEFLNLTENAD
jgi:hypothetical protein